MGGRLFFVGGAKPDQIEVLRSKNEPPALRPWGTLRDALAGFGSPNEKNNHALQKGLARTLGIRKALWINPPKR